MHTNSTTSTTIVLSSLAILASIKQGLRWLFVDCLVFSVAVLSVHSISLTDAFAQADPIRINSGGPAYTDSLGQFWSADAFFSGGSGYITSSSIAGTLDPVLYQSERWGIFNYQVPVTNGNYFVTLHFAEIYFTFPGLRVFDVLAEGALVVDGLDLNAEVGSFAAYSRSFQVAVADGTLDLQSASVVQNPKISAIEIISADGGSTPFLELSTTSVGFPAVTVGSSSAPAIVLISNTGAGPLDVTSLSLTGTHSADFSLDVSSAFSIAPQGSQSVRITFSPTAIGARQATLSIESNAPSSPDAIVLSGAGLTTSSGEFELRINSGGGSFTDSIGHLWEADTNYSGGSAFISGSSIAETVDDLVYQSERWGSFEYAIPVSNGTYELRLHFAEVYFTNPGQRVLAIAAEGDVVVAALDIVAAVGPFTATVRSADVTVNDGVLNLTALPVVQNPKLAGIELIEKAGVSLTPLSAEFGSIELGTTSLGLELVIRNTSPDTVTINAIGLSGADGTAFAIAAPTTPFDIPASGQAGLTLTFSPTQARAYQAELVVTPAGSLPELQAQLSGSGREQGLGPVLSLSPNSLNFASQTVGTTSAAQSFVVSNTGDEVLTVSSVSLSGSDASDFALQGQSSFSVSAGGSQTLAVQFSPVSSGAKQATISVISNGGSDSLLVSGQANDQSGNLDAIRINSGGLSYTDSLGNAWEADRDFTSGGTYASVASIAETVDDSLFQSERYGSFNYSIPVPDGDYWVTLYFAEIYFNDPGLREMTVEAEGVPVLTRYDITASAGAFTATSEVFEVSVADGELSLAFLPFVQNAKVSAIEILPTEGLSLNKLALDFGQQILGNVSSVVSVQLTNTTNADILIENFNLSGGDAADFVVLTSSPVFVPASGSLAVDLQFSPSRSGAHSAILAIKLEAPIAPLEVSLGGLGQLAEEPPGIRINAGGPDYTDTTGALWNADINFSGGQAYAKTLQIDGTSEQVLYQTERWGTFNYAVPVLNGVHQVDLHFAEIYFSGVGFRVFDVSAEGALVVDDLDIVFEAGGTRAAMIRSFDVLVEDGVLNLSFLTEFEQPKLSALEVLLIDEAVDLAAVPNPIDAGAVVLGGAPNVVSVRLDNTGVSAISVSDFSFSGLHAADFSTSQGVPFNILAGGFASFDITFNPTSAGDKSANLAISSNDPKDLDGIQNVAVVARGILDEQLLAVQSAVLDFGAALLGDSVNKTVLLRSAGGQALIVSDIRIEGANAGEFSLASVSLPQTLLLDEQIAVEISFNPSSANLSNADLIIESSSVGGPHSVALSGLGIDTVPIGFSSRAIGTSATPGLGSLFSPTSLTFGSDGRLYVGQFDGLIHALTIDSDHNVVSAEVFNTIHNSTTFNEDGSLAAEVVGRLVTGVWADPSSSPSAPVLYVAHSDIRIGTETNGLLDIIDTDSGVITKLVGPDFDNPANRTDLVVGLPRSRENHSPNGIQIGPDGWLYISIGGHTNYGAPSVFFGHMPEVNLSAAVLRLNKDALSGTLDVSAGSQIGSGVGDGEIPGLFEVYSDGYRNAYDLLWHSNGKLYLNMNEGNGGLGNTPGPADGCPQAFSMNPGSGYDKLFIVAAGVYGGHPVPARGHCVLADGSAYATPLVADPAYTPHIHEYRNSVSVNGLAEYTSLVFDGQMFGDLITVSTFLGDEVRWLEMSVDGTQVVNESVLANGMGGPIDVLVHSDGTIFVAEFSANAIAVLEPQDSSATPGDFDGDGILDINDPDDDNDGYSDDDEAANGTNPTNPAQFPSDFDGDYISDLLDSDDDQDGILDVNDAFVFDTSNGNNTSLPISFEWNPGDTFLGMLRDTGFTGFVQTSNGSGFLPGRVNVGAAGGFMSIIPTAGTLAGVANSQDNALQIGVDASPITGIGPFTATTRIVEPFMSPPAVPQGEEGGGLFAAMDEDNYIRLALVGDGGAGVSALQFSLELDGILIKNLVPAVPLVVPGPEGIELFLGVDPENQRITALYRVDSSSELDLVEMGVIGSASHPGISVLFSNGLGLGLAGTLAGQSSGFVSVFDYFRAFAGIVGSGGAPDAVAQLIVDGGGTLIDSSTYFQHSFALSNASSGGQYLTRLRIDLRTAVLPDVVFDPDGLGGDTVGWPFTVDAEGGVGILAHQMREPTHGGYRMLDVEFGDFAPSKSMSFSIDLDPSSIKGAEAPGPNHSGSISGLEMMGATVTAFFDDGSVFSAELQRSGTSEVASNAIIRLPNVAPPILKVLTVAAVPSEVYSTAQTIQLTGLPGADVRLYVFEGALFSQGLLNGGFMVSPFEANSFIALSEVPAVFDGSGVLEVPISLTRSDLEGGLNYIFAIQRVGGVSSGMSTAAVLELLP